MIGLLKHVRAALLTLLFCCCAAGPIHAHALAPVLATITESSTTDFHVAWSFSRNDWTGIPDSFSLSFSPGCTLDRSASIANVDNRWLREELYVCTRQHGEPLDLRVLGLESADSSVAVRVRYRNREEEIHLLDEATSTISLWGQENGLDSSFQYLVLGAQHILQGADHLVFVIAMCFLAAGAIRPLIGLITAFTVAHSITLSAAVLGWVHLPARPVEALIALSIALVAVDLVRNKRFSRSRAIDYWPLVFVFGLLHGLGFAGSLMEFGLPRNPMLAALLTFNLGVELGQLVLVFGCAVLIRQTNQLRQTGWVNPATGLVIGCTAGYWFVSRVV